jgi:predicted nucleic acid-binding protein
MNLFTRIQDKIDDILNYFGHYYFHMIVLMHVIYVFVFIGIIAINSLFLKTFNILIQTFVCVFLLFRFHPYRHHKLREYDTSIIFSSAGFLLFNMILVEFFSVYKLSKTETTPPETKKISENPIVRGLMPLQFQ